MSKISEQKALKAYPIKEEWVGNQYGGIEDTNSLSREKKSRRLRPSHTRHFQLS
jgi:hypothetical protein